MDPSSNCRSRRWSPGSLRSRATSLSPYKGISRQCAPKARWDRIVGGELLHLVEAVCDRIGFGLVAHMPFAGKIRRVAVLSEEFGDRRRLCPEVVLVTWGDDDRQRRADRVAPGQKRRAA